MSNIVKTITGGVLAGALAFSISLAPNASAAQPGDYLYDGVNIRQSGNTSSLSLGMGYIGQGLRAICSAQGGSDVNGDTHWIKHTNNKSGITGYSTKEYVTWSGSIPASVGQVCNG
jgi:hypothetical protein